MTDLVASELLKLRTTRTFFGLVGAALGLILLITVLTASLVPFDPGDTPFIDLIAVSPLAGIFALVLGILAISTEFRHGTVTPSLLTVPNRTRWAVSKLIANGVAGLLLGLAAALIPALLILLIFAVRGVDSSADAGDVVNVVLGSAVGAGLFAALGVGLGALIRNQAGAIVAALVWLFFLEGVLGVIPGLDEVIPKYGPAAAWSAVSSIDAADDQLGQLSAGLVLAVYALLFLAAGIAMLQRRDVAANSS
ncbi:ABC transporter permease subunit [Svornostia abyssi]|uniref:ABC transporter permease subunit n=1 Tax=Svornostia abyssi TaxID=2898438 RepID=A0ABY5PK93_9ACTN|nr:ABC transporter permease subunit [Parviterribacteraceae bacterium J379]